MADHAALRTALLSAIMHSTEAMVLSDPALPDNPIIAVNAAFEALSQYPAVEIVGRNCRFMQGPQTDRDTAARIRTAIADGHGCIEWIVNHRRDGESFWNLLFISPVHGPNGEIVCYLGNQVDAARGMPAGLDEFPIGRAHMSAETQAAFHASLAEIMAHDASDTQARGLERILAAAREVSTLSLRLEAGRPA